MGVGIGSVPIVPIGLVPRKSVQTQSGSRYGSIASTRGIFTRLWTLSLI